MANVRLGNRPGRAHCDMDIETQAIGILMEKGQEAKLVAACRRLKAKVWHEWMWWLRRQLSMGHMSSLF